MASADHVGLDIAPSRRDCTPPHEAWGRDRERALTRAVPDMEADFSLDAPPLGKGTFGYVSRAHRSDDTATQYAFKVPSSLPSGPTGRLTVASSGSRYATGTSPGRRCCTRSRWATSTTRTC